MNAASIWYDKITADDFPELQQLSLQNGGNKGFSGSFFQEHYLGNPTNRYTAFKSLENGKCIGYATTNNHWLLIGQQKTMVAFPQNLLTARHSRGKGVFRQLYLNTEEQNIRHWNIQHFMVFSNARSTPIFLKHLGYERSSSPDLWICPFSPATLFKRKQYQRLTEFSEIDFTKIIQTDNSFFKDETYFRWRYRRYDQHELHILRINKNGQSYALLKSTRVKGLPALILMDVLIENTDQYTAVMDACRHYCSKHYFAAVLMFELPLVKTPFSIKINNRFNFLVKGATKEITALLLQTRFNFNLGDLDIF